MSQQSSTVDHVRQDADQLSNRLLHCQSRDEALEVAIQAAETSMRALKLAKDPTEKSQLSKRVQQLLDEADRIKTDPNWKQVLRASHTSPNGTTASKQTSSGRALKEPVSSRTLPKSEQILLLKASLLNGFKFPPWDTPPAAKEFALGEDGELYVDGADLSLSKFQRDVFDGWRRPAEALPPPAWYSEDRSHLGPHMGFSRKIDIVQDAATDCSVVASLCAGVARAERGYAKILRAVLHPYDPENGRPQMSENGKYIVRLNFNGCYRKVVIDDRLPTSNTSRVIHVVDRHNPGLLWPALLEKAYLKVRGGYDFPGSNSGTDLWILSGWIPEQVFLQSDDLEPDTFWRRTLNAFNYGDVMVTMGTGKISARTEREIGLAGEHDYAVLDMRECDGQKLFLVKNPWCEGTSWRGRFKTVLRRRDTTASADMALLDLSDDGDEPVQSSRDLLNADSQLSPGTFWMDLDNVIQYFESIYLNWNPGLLANRHDIHFAWNLSEPTAASGHFGSLKAHPQFALTVDKPGTVWLLLCRHFRNLEPSDTTEQTRPEFDIRGFISLHAFKAKGNRVLLGERAIEKSNFVDSPQILLKIDDCQPEQPITVVPAEQELPGDQLTFTLSAFSNSTFKLDHAAQRFPCRKTIAGAWTKDTAGGNAHSPTYSTNPQFSINLLYKTSLSLLLEAVSDELNVHLKLVHGKGQRIRSIRNRDIVVDSKDYRRRCCVAETGTIEPGAYTVIVSTFEPHQHSKFSILAESMLPVQLALLPREGAGWLRSELPVASFSQGLNRIATPLAPARLVKMYAVARPHGFHRSPSSLLRLSIELGRGPQKWPLSSSGGGDYSDAGAGGIQTEDVDLGPEMLRRGDIWLVLERMYVSNSQEKEERYGVEVYVDQPGAMQWGYWREWDD